MTAMVDPDLAALDIMLVDQVLRGRIRGSERICDLGCGGGRNLRWFARRGHSCVGVDPDQGAIAKARVFLQDCIDCRLLVGTLPDPRLGDERFDLVIVNAVLHFAPDHAAFAAWFAGAAARVADGGRLFLRCASRLAWPGADPCDPDGRVIDPHCHFSFLPDRDQIEAAMQATGLRWDEPPKTSVVDTARCMSTLIFSR